MANNVLRFAAPNLDLRVRPRTYPRALGVVDGWPREPVSRRSRRRTRGNYQDELLDRADAVFFPDLQHSNNRHLWRAQPFSKHAAVRPAALRRDWRHMGVPFHVHLLDDPEESD